jgi:tricorn protease-like protein
MTALANRPLSAMQRAEDAIAANPEKSDRAIAAEIGVGNKTVSRARERITVSGDTVAKRIGRDGRARGPRTMSPEAERLVHMNDEKKRELYEKADDEMKRWAEQYFDWPKKRRDQAWLIIINHTASGNETHAAPVTD